MKKQQNTAYAALCFFCSFDILQIMNYVHDDERVTYFAATHTRGQHRAFGIRAKDRMKHVYIIGKTGMGKSTLLENMAIQDIQNGEGMAFIDPHGSTAEKLLDFVPQDRVNDVLYFAPFDTDYPVGFNVMEDVGFDKRHLVVSGLMGTFKRIWVDAWSARMEYILSNTLLALLEYPDSTLLDVNRMLVNKEFRRDVITHITDPIVKEFWAEEFAGYSDRYTQDATPAIQNKIGQFISNPLIRNIIGQPRSTFNLRTMMDERKLLIVNLSKGRLGETNASLLGSMLTVKIYLSAMSRADASSAEMKNLPPFYFYVDEFQSVVNDAFADILSEARKYKLALTIAHQYIEQMEENVRNAVFGNVGTFIAFRVGPFDAEELKVMFEPTFFPEDLVGLDRYQAYLTLMIDGAGSKPFSAQTLPPIEDPEISFKDQIVEQSRARFGRRRSSVETAILERQQRFMSSDSERKKGANSRNNQGRGPRSTGGPNHGGRQEHPRNERPWQERQEHPPAPPQPQPPRDERSPADILRARRESSKEPRKAEKQGNHAGSGGVKKEEQQERTSLRDAITAATKGHAPEMTTSVKQQPAVNTLTNASNASRPPLSKSIPADTEKNPPGTPGTARRDHGRGEEGLHKQEATRAKSVEGAPRREREQASGTQEVQPHVLKKLLGME
jgi:hypothetical protein